VAVVDRGGRVAVHTGLRCIPHAGHSLGEQVSAQANMMERDTVPGAMIRAYTDSRGEPLAERLLAALDAAEAEGGDIRGRQSAAMIVVAARASGTVSEDRPVDLRVDDHPDPVRELRRLLGLRRAYTRASAGDDLAGAGDLAGALEEYEAAHLAEPDNLELAFWYGLALAGNGRAEEAIRVMRGPFEAHHGWVELLKRLPEAGLIPDDPELIGLLTGERAVSHPGAPGQGPEPPAPVHPRPPAPPPAQDFPSG
jgi:uncharacterized Ntn-hydrolase superfamily protein